ncbi:DUF4129 domain-containing protein [Sanguibacter suaedae]|uniref:DUF4129 domain-containing protein n=1 Tax=Sanguibacter suaedae TaxID=2795737 RepID=A0A934IE19_9MICO|nr:DUF4129 domain-containing protein [Sanguibacter suaedae]MBI9116025.1 DUF4129 domain-containing protein [Sanguibacter suaedae]
MVLAQPAVVGEVPVDPDAATARRWLQDELTDAVYHDRPSLLERFVSWLGSLFDGVSVAGLDGLWAALVVVGAVLAVAAVALYVAGPVRRSGSARRAPVLAEDDTRSADDLRAAAAVAAARGDLHAATLDAFRAVVRRSEERVLLDPRPGRTAHEAATELASRLPTVAPALARGAQEFDALLYGRSSTADHALYVRTCELDDAAAATTPTLPARQGTPLSVGAP